jgi:hypothetical protein
MKRLATRETFPMLVQRAESCAPKIGVDFGLGNVALQWHGYLREIVEHDRFDVMDFRNERSGLPSAPKWTGNYGSKLPIPQVVGKPSGCTLPSFCQSWVGVRSPIGFSVANDSQLKGHSITNPPLAVFGPKSNLF